MKILLFQELIDYCKRFYKVLKHPFYLKAVEEIDDNKLEEALLLFEHILEERVMEVTLQDIDVRFNSAFNSYLYVPRFDFGNLSNSIEKLASLLDPFLKKMVFLFYSNLNIQKGNKLIPLWQTSDFSDILEKLKICTCDLRKKSDDYWRSQDCKQAMLRVAFASRHKSVHESHFYNLIELEKIAYSVIGTYIITCLKIIEDKNIMDKLSFKMNLRRFKNLLKYKVEAYDTTKTLLSKDEYLNIYLYRENTILDENDIYFLFLNYLDEKGPIFFWLKDIGKNTLIKWAKKCMETKLSNEIIMKNTIRYLIRNGETFKLELLSDIFSAYTEKEELASYIRMFAKKEDLDILLKLYTRSKAEEIVEASKDVLSKIISKEEKLLYKLIQSESEKKRILLEKIIKELANKSKLCYYRNFINAKDPLKQIFLIYLLGEIGKKEDINLIKDWLSRRRRNSKVTYTCWYAITSIACKIRNYNLVNKLINSDNTIISNASLNTVTREGLNGKIKKIINLNKNKEIKIDVLARISNHEDLEIIKRYLKRIKLNNTARPLILTICELGSPEEFDFLLDLFLNYPNSIEFYNHIRIANAMGNLCERDKQLDKLKQFINSPDFWSFYRNNRPHNKINIKKYENLPLIRRIIAYAFCKIASYEEKFFLRKLLEHNYSWISNLAIHPYIKISDKNDLNNLIKYILTNIDKLEEEKIGNLIKTICNLDQKLYEGLG